MSMPTEMWLKSATAASAERFNYIGMHRYLITLPTLHSASVFTGRDVVVETLNRLRDTGLDQRFDIYAYCFLPDRLLLIVRGKDDAANMKAFLRAFRESSDAAIQPRLGHPLWSRKYLERVLRRTEDSREIARKVFDLPVKAGLAGPGKPYPFQGSFVVVNRKETRVREKRGPDRKPRR
jgi:putative transposase